MLLSHNCTSRLRVCRQNV